MSITPKIYLSQLQGLRLEVDIDVPFWLAAEASQHCCCQLTCDIHEHISRCRTALWT